MSGTWDIPADEPGICGIARGWCYWGPLHTRKTPSPPSTTSPTSDPTHMTLGDSWLLNNLGGRQRSDLPDDTSGGTEAARRSDQSEPLQPWEPGLTSGKMCGRALLLLIRSTSSPKGFFISRSLVLLVQHWNKLCIILNDLITLSPTADFYVDRMTLGDQKYAVLVCARTFKVFQIFQRR